MAPVLRNRKGAEKAVDEVAKYSHKLAKEVNTDDPDAVINYIEYFGKIESVHKGRVIGVDSEGFDLLYTIHGDSKKREVRVKFDESVSTVDGAKEKLQSMAKEAHKVLHYDIDKTYVSPNAKKHADWHGPKTKTFVFMSVVWTTILLAVQLEDDQLPHSILVNARQIAGGVRVFEKILFGVFLMHLVESVVALGLCLYARVPVRATLFWIPTVFVFGIPSLQDCLKVAVRHAMYRDPVTFGVPKNVLNGHYMKYRRIITDADLGLNEDGTTKDQ
ncbi:UNVERIFIED_CONTAM: hypothetical protein HDU68_003942 [Siphonaria sp. JEL0065]|nr:hypothetical protein HDU68_003942 [Siphonaria sp. JEL0065]